MCEPTCLGVYVRVCVRVCPVPLTCRPAQADPGGRWAHRPCGLVPCRAGARAEAALARGRRASLVCAGGTVGQQVLLEQCGREAGVLYEGLRFLLRAGAAESRVPSAGVCSRKTSGCCAEDGLGPMVLAQTVLSPPDLPGQPPRVHPVLRKGPGGPVVGWGPIRGVRAGAPVLGRDRHHQSLAALSFPSSWCSGQTQTRRGAAPGRCLTNAASRGEPTHCQGWGAIGCMSCAQPRRSSLTLCLGCLSPRVRSLSLLEFYILRK